MSNSFFENSRLQALCVLKKKFLKNLKTLRQGKVCDFPNTRLSITHFWSQKTKVRWQEMWRRKRKRTRILPPAVINGWDSRLGVGFFFQPFPKKEETKGWKPILHLLSMYSFGFVLATHTKRLCSEGEVCKAKWSPAKLYFLWTQIVGNSFTSKFLWNESFSFISDPIHLAWKRIARP